MTNGELLKLYETLNRLTEDRERKFNVRLGYLLAKNKAMIKQDIQLIYDAKQKIIYEYGEPQENGDVIIPQDKIDTVQKKLDELLDINIDVPLIYIPIEDFNNYEFNLNDIDNLQPIILDLEYTSDDIE